MTEKVTKPIEYPIPKVDEVIDVIGNINAQIFSVLYYSEFTVSL